MTLAAETDSLNAAGLNSGNSNSGNSNSGNLEAWLPKFKLSGFRPGQRDVIQAVMAGEDCLCVMPTGGGKSLCYQLPAIARTGTTLVVSPLIALMKDQVDQLQALGLRATFINSTLTGGEQYARLEAMASGQYDLVYVVPERFRSPRFLEALRAANLQLLAIDEAHCISEWGHDFRPDYAKLGRFRQMLGNPPTIALTATATDTVRRDIVAQLAMRSPRTFITGFARPNLYYEVQNPGTAKRKDQVLTDFVRGTSGSGIIYASTRKRCEELSVQLAAETGRRVGAYHAGMLPDARRTAQDDFMQGRYDIVVATTAFGMGIDKADVRFVVHYNLPGTLEGYYQEAGRAGRDGQPSHCLLLYSTGDRRIQEFFIESAYPARETVAQVYNFLRHLEQDPIELTQQEIKDALNLPIGADGVGNCEQLLEKAGVLERLEPCENMAIVRIDSDQPTLVDFLPKQAKVQRRVMQAIERLIGSRRYEAVYFQPRDLLAETELDPAGLSRTLRELKHLKAFDYVPPFRGRAVHVIDGDKPFHELDIDFELLEQRKSAEFEKLRRVISFAQGTRCRQQEILEYFGQADSAPCGHCDNCSRHRPDGRAKTSPAVSAIASPRLEEVVRIALAGVARSRSRFGKILVASMLCGSKSAKIKKFGLDRLSTYGLLQPLKQDDVAELLTALIAAGFVEQIELEQDRPIVRLTELGQTLMAAPGTVPLRVSLSPEILLKLNSVRHVEAKPTSERTAKAPSVRPPGAPADALQVASPVRAAPIAASAASDTAPNEFSTAASTASAPSHAPISQSVTPATAPDATGSTETGPVVTDGQGSHYWTWRLLSKGFTVDECAVIRGLEREVVLDHALRAIDCGWLVEIAWFLAPEQIQALERVIGAEEPSRVRPLLAKLPAGTRYEDVQLFLKCRRVRASDRPGP